MDILEYFFENSPKNDFFIPRKLKLPENSSFVLYGARAVGKTALILEFLRPIPRETFLYVDAQDPVFAMEDIDAGFLEKFMEEEKIGTLILDHWFEGFLERYPRVERLILVSREKPSSDMLPSYELFPLDYEEFLGFDRGHSGTSAFNRFLKTGSLPAANRSSASSVILHLRQLFYEKFNDQESRLLLILARFHGRKVTVHQIYTVAREFFRISKDWIYSTVSKFENEKLLAFIEPVRKENGKKLLLYDFALTRYLNKRQPFAITFDTMTALTLLKHGFRFESVSTLGYYLTDRAEMIIPSPFEGEEQFRKRLGQHRKILGEIPIQKVYVVTVSNRFRFRISSTDFEALPFYEWSILNE